MNIWDAVILLLVAVALGVAVWIIIKNRKSGKSCCGDCSSCRGCSKGCQEKNENDRK